jgi:hypothetical protein
VLLYGNKVRSSGSYQVWRRNRQVCIKASTAYAIHSKSTAVYSTKTPIPVHSDNPSNSHQIPGFQTPPPPADRTLAVNETSFSLRPVNPNACDGELRCINYRTSSSKPSILY